MNASDPNQIEPRDAFRPILADSIRFWETRRIVYNIVLSGVTIAWIWASWPHVRPAMTLQSLGILTVLALIANLFYCAGYLVDLPMLFSPLRETWRHRRWILWLAGTLFAFVFTNYWIADEIYPFVR